MGIPKSGIQSNASLVRGWTAAVVLAVLLTMARTPFSWAQSGRANISGTVTDSFDIVVEGAIVTATNLATGVSTPVTTNASGLFNIIQVIPGTYTINVEKPGFSSQEQRNISLVAEQNFGANFTLRPGAVSERVTVEAVRSWSTPKVPS